VKFSCRYTNINHSHKEAMDSAGDTIQVLHRGSPFNSDDVNKSTQCSDNPLMKLVDAALRPSSLAMDEATEIVSNGGTKNLANASNRDSSSLVDVDQQNDEKPSSEDAPVIRGTLQDLVSRQEKKVSFAEYLMECLNDEANHDVIRWMPCGTQFTIKNHRKFTMERMPQLFKIRNMSSFVRKLTRWGFSRVHEKETGNSDIFKHMHFQRDNPELCKKIRCVNKAMTEAAKARAPSNYSPGDATLMGDISDSKLSKHGYGYHQDMNFRMVSPHRSMSYGGSLYSGHSPHPNEPVRYMSYQTPRANTSYIPPRISPESEKEMMKRKAFPAQLKPPQVYTPLHHGQTMSVAAEHELEQILLERHRARMYREQLQASNRQPFRRRLTEVSVPVPGSPLSGSERSGDRLSEGHVSMQGSYLNLPPDSHAMTAALEKLQREGEFDLDMSPREAMFRAVLHKRQQQLAAKQQRESNGTRIHPVAGTYHESLLQQPPNRSSQSGRFSSFFG
jgi:HSF-type DNA-binding